MASWADGRLGAYVLAAIVLAVGTAVVAWLALVLLPEWLVGGISGSLSPAEYAQAIGNARGASLQLVAGLGVGGGLVFTALQLRQRRHEQAASLFLNAIDKLADERLEAQLYGIHGLDRVAGLSAQDRNAVERILSLFARQHISAWREQQRKALGKALGAVKTAAPGRSDPALQAAIATLGRQRRSRRREPLDLEGLYLSQPHLDGMDFERVCLRNANLGDGHFNRTSFRNSSLRNAAISGELRGADFQGADLRGARIAAIDEHFAEDVHFAGAYYNSSTVVEPSRLEAALHDSGIENDDVWPLLEGCR